MTSDDMKPVTRIKKCCPHCGGINVKCDAWAEWSTEYQDWVIGDTYPNGWCDDCECEFKTFDDVELEDAP